MSTKSSTEQAIAGATKKVAADKLKEERKEDKKKRSRVTVKKENADKVFSSTKNGELTKTDAKTPAAKTQPQPKTTEPTPETAKEANAEIKRHSGRICQSDTIMPLRKRNRDAP